MFPSAQSDADLFRFCAERLTSLVRTLELTQIDEHFALQKVASFATLVATYEKGEILAA
jgi:DNA excision repair protein ERCC-2